jgi:enoyl-CoA hydratase
MTLVLTAVEDRGDAGTVARVKVNNPEQRNALGNAGKRELAEAIEALSERASLRAIVLTGEGDRSFISGANIAEMATFERGHATEGPSLTHRVCEAIRRAPVPVIARVNGWCLGAGLEIAAACARRRSVVWWNAWSRPINLMRRWRNGWRRSSRPAQRQSVRRRN